MATSHLKRLNAPNSWKIRRRGIKFITRPNPGPHTLELCMPLSNVVKDMLGVADITKDVKALIRNKEILVDGKAADDTKFQVGLFDVMQLPKTDEHYRMLIDEKGYLTLHKIDKKEASFKPCKIVKKTALKGGKLQLNLDSGINLLADKNDYKTGDSLMIELPSKKVLEHIKLEKGAYIFLSGGKHKGNHGVVEELKEGMISYKSASGEKMETPKKYAVVIGKDKPKIALIK